MLKTLRKLIKPVRRGPITDQQRQIAEVDHMRAAVARAMNRKRVIRGSKEAS